MSRRRRKSHEDETNYWMSYADMLVSLLLIFALVIVFSTFKSKYDVEQAKSELESMNEIILEQQRRLDSVENWEAEKTKLLSQKNELEIEIDTLSKQITQASSEVAEQKNKIENLESVNTEKELEIKLLSEQLQLVELEKEAQATELEEQKTKLSEQQATMDAQQEKLDKLIGIRSELVEALRKEFDDTALNVNVDEQTGAITFDSNILFDYNKNNLKDTGKEFLVDFIPRYISILQNEKFNLYIAEIIIEGHTDTDGSYLFNLELSQKRALEVAKYFLSSNEKVLDEEIINSIRPIITANGRSFSNPILNGDGSVNKDASRRVEIKFRLKDEEMIQEMREILEDNL